MAEATSGAVAGRYTSGAVLGHGGVGEVRAGFDQRLGREVALKRLRPEMARVPGVAERFEHEARMAARLVHPHIVAVFDFAADEGTPFIVMERLSGQTLADVVARGPLGFAEAEELGLQVLDALAAAHASGMIHRDIKPRNVLVAGPGNWKVGDFGIAKSLDVGADPTLTGTGLVVGTPGYLPPERLTGSPATVAGDIYGVGVVLFQALTGRPPFEPGVNLAALLGAVPPPLEQLRPGIPTGLAAVVSRAMARDPAERFPTATAMAAALRAAPRAPGGAVGPTVMDGAMAVALVPPAPTEVLAASPPGGGGSARPVRARPAARLGRRHRELAPAAVAVVLVVLASFIVLVSGGGGKTTSHTTSTTAPRSASAAPPASVVPAAATPRSTSVPGASGASGSAGVSGVVAALDRLARAVQP